MPSLLWLPLAAVFGAVPSTAPPPPSAPMAPWCDSTQVTDPLPPGGHQIMLVACTVTPADSTALRRAFTYMTRVLILYDRLLGVPYPGTHYTMEFKPYGSVSGGGLTMGGGLVWYDLPLPDARTERDRPALTAKVLAHELAHQWGGPYAEGFADFMAGQVWRATAGPRAEEEFLFFYNARWSSAFYDDPAVRGVLRTLTEGWYSLPWPGAEIWTSSLDHNDDPYYRAALVLWMLQQYLGDARFWAAMHTFETAPAAAFQAFRTHDFQSAIQMATGEDLGWFFQEWVHGTGYPRFTVAATYDAAAQRVTLRVRQAVPVFRMPVTVRVGTVQGDLIAHATVDSLAQTLVVEHVPRPPTFVVFDDGDAIVKTLDFAQPTAWLVAQARREARPWQTWWVIEQLRHRAGQDPAAAAALVTAAQQGHYALTRAQALAALGAVVRGAPPAAVALRSTVMRTMTAGMQDTAVMVRQAAVQGLEALGTPAARAVERAAVTHDSSDLVRAEAVQSLLLAPATPPAERQTVFAQALLWPPTYLDLVPTTAISAMAQTTCDSTTVATLQAAMRHPGVTAMLQRVTNNLIRGVGPLLDPTCMQTFAAQLPLPGASP